MTVPLDDSRFNLSPNARFRERFGPQGKSAPKSHVKLCLVATDAAFLVDLLYGLSLRADCYYVKYGLITRDGMVLGRCFLQSDAAAAELCQALKGHPRLMVSLQNDDFFNDFREPDADYGVWDDLAEDQDAVLRVHRQAFGQSLEANLVAALRRSRVPTISLVVQVAPETRGQSWPIVGHVLLSPVTLDGNAQPRGLGLAPLAVRPEYQRRGHGSRLVQAALERAKLLGCAYVVVLGDPNYYGRFGFLPAARFGLRYPDASAQDAFGVVELVSGALQGLHGEIQYDPAFEAALSAR